MHLQRGFAILLLVSLPGLFSCNGGGSDDGHAVAVANPVMEGPITGPGSPFVRATAFDLAREGYEQAEYFISGAANSYSNVGQLTADGAWSIQEAAVASYKTRIIVYRPTDPAGFNGSVILEWLNVTGGLDAAPDWVMAHTELLRQGYAWVGVSAQFVGVEGSATSLVNLGLKQANAARYASLSHPGDSFSYAIYAQAAQAVRHPSGIDPLPGMAVQQLIAAGESQSASRLTTFINALEPGLGLFDAYFVHSRGGGSAPLSQSPQAAIEAPAVVRIREDLHIPVLNLQTETDVLGLHSLASRQDDSAFFRLWEVAGTAHLDTYGLVVGNDDTGNDPAIADVLSIASPIPGFLECALPINSGPQHWVHKAALHALSRWAHGGAPPALAPRLEVAGDPAAYVLDAQGNARGGIRTPYVDAPVAILSGLGQSGSSFCFLI